MGKLLDPLMFQRSYHISWQKYLTDFTNFFLQPGSTYHESECEVCQCINNNYVCDDTSCKTTTEIPTTTEDVEDETEMGNLSEDLERVSKNVIIVTSTVAPPRDCAPESFVPLINGADPVIDGAFTASCFKETNKPSDARFPSDDNEKGE